MTNNESEFDSIRPYNESEAREALERLSHHPALLLISKYLFPKKDPHRVVESLKEIKTIDQFQDGVMLVAINAVIGNTSEGFTYSGIEYLKSLKGKKFLAVSNHRDIVLDPALIQFMLRAEGLPTTEICVGNNLLSSQWIEDLMRVNRMIKVIRGISARELYLSSQTLSRYIRNTITSGTSSVWIAQREGRTKDGFDTTEQGLLKMFDMSGSKGFVENFKELNIVPMSISYEYEPCDARKAREILIREQQEGSYRKKKNEDLHSIMTGIRQQKGHIHLTIGKPLTASEIEEASLHTGNDRYQSIRQLLDRRIRAGYKLYKTNYMASDLLSGEKRYLGTKYLPEDLEAFNKYIDHKLGKLEEKFQGDSLRNKFLRIYANPLDREI